jgi:hypothetical protein
MDPQIDAFINETTRCFGAAPVSIIMRRGETEMTYEHKDNAEDAVPRGETKMIELGTKMTTREERARRSRPRKTSATQFHFEGASLN